LGASCLRNSSRSATLTVDIEPFYSSFRDDTKERVRFVLSFVLPNCTSFCTNYVISYSLVFFSLAYISCTISCTYIIAIHFIMSLCSLQTSSNVMCSFTSYRPHNVQVLCQNLKCRTVEAPFLKFY